MQNPIDLHREFVRLGSMKLKLKNKMLAILPEIYESGIWKKYAGSIVEYCGKFGDIARTTVIKRLRLEENLVGKPYLRAAIEKVGVHKVAMIAKIATAETDHALAEIVLDMSKTAVQSLSKELRGMVEKSVITEDSLPGFELEAAMQCRATPLLKKIELDEEATFLFLKLKKKLGRNLSDKEFLKNIIAEREKEEFPEKKTKIVSAKSVTGEAFVKVTRYIPAARQREAVAETNGRCGYPNCNNPFAVIHHPERFSIVKNHDSLIPLCKIHHEFAHTGLIQNEKENSASWSISVCPSTTDKTPLPDLLYRKFRRRAAG